jgi:hypothetical protein
MISAGRSTDQSRSMSDIAPTLLGSSHALDKRRPLSSHCLHVVPQDYSPFARFGFPDCVDEGGYIFIELFLAKI